MEQVLYSLAVNAIPFLLAITWHEAARGYAARALGDPTPGQNGRLSLNPLNHFEWFGTAILPALSVITSALVGSVGLILGWAKPIPINPNKFAHRSRDYTLVALAGLGANAMMGIAWALIFRLFEANAIQSIAMAGMLWNVGLIVLHLIPIPPLAAGMALVTVLPYRYANQLWQLSRYSFIIVIALVVLLPQVLRPAYLFGLGLLSLIAKA